MYSSNIYISTILSLPTSLLKNLQKWSDNIKYISNYIIYIK